MIKEQWFETPIWYQDLPYDFSNLINIFIAQSNTEQGVTVSNVGGYQSKSITESLDPNVQQLLTTVNRHVYSALSMLEPTTPIATKITNAWVNVNNPGNYNVRHDHPVAHFSAVLYLQAPEQSGDLIFYRNDLMRHYLGKNIFKNLLLTSRYTPRNNLLVVFPAWIEHEVKPNLSNQKRVSVAFNVRLEIR